MNKVIIVGSSRKDGETQKVVNDLAAISGWDIINLADYQFGYYDYEHQNRNDDYLPLMKKILDQYDTLIFATPVYWYCMSGIMKVFFDRITDLLDIEKDLGRRFRGKKMAVISSSNGSNLGDAFWIPFSMSAEYLGMQNLGNLHTVSTDYKKAQLLPFIDKIKKV